MAFGHLQASALRAGDEQRQQRELKRIGRYQDEQIRDLEREVLALQRENAMLRARLDRAERQTAYYEANYVPRSVRR